ncbi:hypothetical protein BC629DRAFT_1587056 [Irpex lacteus]|nr:hypothetical protein BC629DRAFT_1587056 [Irpex lacteus]
MRPPTHRLAWDLESAAPVFQYLCRVFQSRDIATCCRKTRRIPRLSLKFEMRLLYEHAAGDTAFFTFVKLIAQSADPSMRRVDAQTDPPPSPLIKKLLAHLVPLGSVKFDKGTPATDKELSMLINRFSAVAVGLVLSPASFKFTSPRRVDTSISNRWTSRRGGFAVDEAMDWLTSMTDILVEEFCQGQAEMQSTPAAVRVSGIKDRIAICIQMLLGTVRRIIESPSMNENVPTKKYPILVFERCVGVEGIRIFHKAAVYLGYAARARSLVSAFFDARSAIIPNPPRPRIPQESQDEESQDYYGAMEQINYDDPELAIALGDHREGSDDVQELESKICIILKKDVWPAVNSCVHADLGRLKGPDTEVLDAYWKQRLHPSTAGFGVRELTDATQPWSWFFSTGIPTDGLKQPVRSKTEVCYKLAILRWDPVSYNDYADMFVEHFLQALAAYQVTIEHDYCSLVMVSGGHKHPLLQGVLQACPVEDEDIRLTKADFLNIREELIGHIISNLDASFGREFAADYAMKDQNRLYLSYLSAMFSLMRETSNGLAISDKEEYAGFCKTTATKLVQSPKLRGHCRDSSALAWALSVASNPSL